MNTEIESAITLLAKKIVSEVKSDDALKYTQAALNLAHCAAIASNMKIQEKNAA